MTNQMLVLQRRLRGAGFYSEIYAEHIDPALADRIRPLSDIPTLPATVLIVHHSMGHTAFDQLMRLEMPFVTIFHCITPARFFDDPTLRSFVRLGLRQLRALAQRSVLGIADSNHNRRQMYQAGFTDVQVLPVRTDFADQRSIRAHRTTQSQDWLFVGRMVPNKRQVDLVRSFALHRRAGATGARLHLVGDVSMTSYVERVRAEIARFGLEQDVVIHGKIAAHALAERYRDAGIFMCLSEHEGFGVPLLEAMAAGLPVIARDEAAVAETMGGAGVLLHDPQPATAAAAARVVMSDAALRTRLVAGQDQRLERIERFDVDGFIEDVIERLSTPAPITVQIQGPFETSYSLAVLNRELALHLAEQPEFSVTIHATEGPGDYTPRPDDLARHPEATALYKAASDVAYPDVVIRQMFPPRVRDSAGGLRLQYFGWEESRLPAQIVDEFNRYLDGIGVMSSFVGDVLRRSGVSVPISVVGVGVHRPAPDSVLVAEELAGLRSTTLLHISSAFPRKGVDTLLQAYFDEFSGADDVSLLLKTFPNAHNEVGAILERLRTEHTDPPHVAWIDRDLDRSELDALYGLATAYVHPARGEGFGLPVAEAMLAGVPVISVASTGLADFVSDRTAAVVRHRWTTSTSHVAVPGSEWAEPDLGDLRTEMRSVADGSLGPTRAARVETARRLIEDEFSWRRVADRWRQFVLDLRARQRGVNVAAVTTYNSRCGIAEYSAHLYGAMGEHIDLEVHADDRATPLTAEHEVGVIRSWPNDRGPIDRLLASLDASTADIVHIQHNMGFFSLSDLGAIIRRESPRRPVVVTLHRTHPLRVADIDDSLEDIADELRQADAIIVHQEGDRERLARAGVTTNVHVLLHGTESAIDADALAARQRHGMSPASFVLGTYGFMLPHKGLVALLEALAMLRADGIDARLVAACALHPNQISSAHLGVVQHAITRLGLQKAVHLNTDFLDPASSRDLLACADVLVLPYEETLESASGALRSVLPLGRPIVTTDLGIFEDVRSVAVTVPAPADPGMLARTLEELWLDDERREAASHAVQQFAASTNWSVIGSRTLELYRTLLSRRAGAEGGATAQ